MRPLMTLVGLACLPLLFSQPCRAQCEADDLVATDSGNGFQFGSVVSASGDAVLVGSPGHTGQGGGSGAAYIFRFDGLGWTEEALLQAPDGVSNDLFGSAVALDGDVAAIGAYFTDDNGSNAGSVYVYRFDGLDWVFEQELIAASGSAGDQFGQSVAISGGTIAAGSPRDDDLGSNTGSVSIFRFDGAAWVEDPLVLSPDPADHDQFGHTLALDGTRLLVGVPFDDDAGASSGAVHVFHDEAGTWVAQPKLTASDAFGGDQFGHRVAIHGDWMLVSAFRADSDQQNEGAAYVFAYDGQDWIEQDILHVADPVLNGELGHSLDIIDDPVAGAIAAVGAVGADGTEAGTGAVYIFRDGGGPWFQSAKLTADLGQSDDAFGQAVAIVGDELLIGAPKSDLDGSNAGQLNVFTGLLGDDCDGNGTPDACEDDCDDNGLADLCEILDDPGLDANVNGILDHCEDCNDNQIPDSEELDEVTDCNNDGTLDECQIGCAEPECLADINDNGIPDVCDPDCDGDGEPDDYEISDNGEPDCNDNGIPDACDIADLTSLDDNGNGTPDECETDCDGNGLPDDLDIDAGAIDCNENGVPDVCEINFDSTAPGGPFFCEDACDIDCNDNGVPDECDIVDDPQLDLNGNGIIDTCDADCDGSGFPDWIELDLGLLDDCNANLIPDICEILIDGQAPGGPYYCETDCDIDCNANGVPDSCDIEADPELDVDANGVIDDCDPDCDGNGQADHLDIAADPKLDQNDNGTLDSCEDCDGNGIADDIDIAADPALDCNTNGVLDQCDTGIINGVFENGDGWTDHLDDGGSIVYADALLVSGPDASTEGVAWAGQTLFVSDQLVFTLASFEAPDDLTEDDYPVVVLAGVTYGLNHDGTLAEAGLPGTMTGLMPLTGDPIEFVVDLTALGVSLTQEIGFGVASSSGSGGAGLAEFAAAAFHPDCDANGIPDDCDLADGAPDTNNNGVQDACDPDCNGNSIPDDLDIFFGFSEDENGNGIPDECDPDLDQDGDVDVLDLLALLGQWGPCPPEGACPADFDLSGDVDVLDLLQLLGAWG